MIVIERVKVLQICNTRPNGSYILKLNCSLLFSLSVDSSDYFAHEQTLTFSPTQTEYDIMVAIRDDNMVEDLENFQVLAEIADYDTSRISIMPESSMVVIEDEAGT